MIFFHKKKEKRLYKIHKKDKVYTSFLMRLGRIAQLVERLSYTQVVIGSSPVAPKHLNFAGVVQWLEH